MKRLSEVRAWRVIAEKIANHRWSRNGLCYEVGVLSMRRQIHWEMEDKMRGRISDHMEVDPSLRYSCYGFPVGEGSVRVLAALFLALEAKDEKAV